MKCTPINLNGMTGYVCSRSRGRTKPCSEPSCGRPSTKLCDFELGGRRAGKTCDRPICDAHAHSQGTHEAGEHQGDSIDYCGAHHERAQQLEQEAAAHVAEPGAAAPAPCEQRAFDFGDSAAPVRAS